MLVDGPLDILDHSCPILGYGSKMGIDATRKWKSEGFERSWPKPIVMSQKIQDVVSQKWNAYGFAGAVSELSKK
jgi:4-hydroxy-3-polyprenylbenzoate decarboxylase